MSTIRVTLEVDSAEDEVLLRQYHAFLCEMKQLALTAPEGQVIDTCEAAVLQKGQEANRRVLEKAVQERITAAEKKGHRSARAAAGAPGLTAVPPHGRS